MANNTYTFPGGFDKTTLRDYGELAQTINAATTVNIDLKNGHHVVVPLIASITSFNITNVLPAGQFCAVVLYIQGDGNARTIAWSVNGGTAKFTNGVAVPPPTTTSGREDKFILWTRNGGVANSWVIEVASQNYDKPV